METICPDPQAPAQLRAVPGGSGPLRFLTVPVSDAQIPASTCTFKEPRCRPAKYEALLLSFGAAAQKKFCEAIEDLPKVKQEHWFIRLLDNNIIPALTCIGFDESFARALFQIAALSWQCMGPISDKCIWFYPHLIRNIRSVRNEIISQAESRPDGFSNAIGRGIRDYHDIEKNYPDPGAPDATCGKPASSWIILPRVYHFLEQQHARCLLGYLKCLEKEGQVEFRKILVRIIIEFTGNFTHKYCSRSFARWRIDSALFYGFTAMFWKNLMHPPAGFEDELICSHCLRWLKLFSSKCARLDHDMLAAIEQMEEQQQKVLPVRDALHATGDGKPGLDSLLVTLRHGQPGMDAVLDYLGMWAYCASKKSADRMPFALRPADVNGLLNAIKMRLPAETPVVQNSMREFVCKLKARIASNVFDDIRNSDHSSQQRQFVVRRILALVDELSGSWAYP